MAKESFSTSGAYALSHRDAHTMRRLVLTAPTATPYATKSRANNSWDLYQTGSNPITGYTMRPRAHSKKPQAAPFTSHRLCSVATTQFPADARYASARMMARSRQELFEGPATSLAVSTGRAQVRPLAHVP
jgi:hypothetical protein